jgi:predicted DNA-binding transcriptional regulator YafY
MLDHERRHKIVRLLRARGAMTKQALMAELEASRATLTRDIAWLRDRADAPIEFDRERQAYVLREEPGVDREYLPGLWFSAGEIHGLLTLYQLAASLEPGLLGDHLAPLIAKLEKQLAGEGLPRETLTQRIRVLHMGHRSPNAAVFEAVSMAVLGQRQLKVCHHNRARDERLVRELSPQRLVHYRDNWYLDAWCHLRQDLRTFALDALEEATLLDAPAKALSAHKVDQHFTSSYGIFAGRADRRAELRFSPERTRWVSKERWHPEQIAVIESDGALRLEVPYHHPQELMMDILRHGVDVEVVGPPELRAHIAQVLKAAAARY